MSLRVIEGLCAADLPVAWDGVPVEWQGWSENRSSLAFHLKPEDLACHQCGAVDECMVNPGIRPPQPGATFKSDRARKTRTGKGYSITTEVPAWPTRDLWAFRCRHCQHDRVWDMRTDETWDLDETDYGPNGSTQPNHQESP